jgi:hypothetical protein
MTLRKREKERVEKVNEISLCAKEMEEKRRGK